MRLRLTTAVVAAALTAAVFTPASARAQAWGEVKGQVIWGPAGLPKNEEAKVNQDKAQCLAKGPIYVNDYVVNPKNKGVRWVMVYLVDAKKASDPLPIHPALKDPPKAPVVIDQPCCEFEPRMVGVREGQKVEIKNPATITHNFKIDGGLKGPNINPLMPPKTSVTIDEVKARPTPVLYSCSIHPWMKGTLFSFNHPYFAVTDEDGKFTIPMAPAGKYRIVLYQEGVGNILYNEATREKGPVIEIKAGAPTELPPYKLTPKKD
jgi:plastocyanin